LSVPAIQEKKTRTLKNNSQYNENQ
jgi:hypothetical protein